MNTVWNIQHATQLGSASGGLQHRASGLSFFDMRYAVTLITLLGAFLVTPVVADPESGSSDSAAKPADNGAPPAPADPAAKKFLPSRNKAAKIKLDKVDIPTQELLLQAFSLIGVNYRYGGKSPETGLDCSGLVRYVFRQSMQMALPHNALAISKMGESIDKQELKPGDLVFFNTLRRQFSHVGIYIGDDMFLHAPSSGGGVQIVNLKDKYWQQRYNGARRIVPTGEK